MQWQNNHNNEQHGCVYYIVQKSSQWAELIWIIVLKHTACGATTSVSDNTSGDEEQKALFSPQIWQQEHTLIYSFSGPSFLIRTQG